MRFAAIADVHGNYLALEAVLADIRAQGISEIVNLGDMASGPLDARRTMDALMALDVEGERAVIRHVADDAAAELAKDGVSTEVIDLRSILPFDEEAILNSVAKTNRVIILHEAPLTGGAGAEFAARIAEKAFDYLDAPIKRVAALDVPTPYSPPLEAFYLPNRDKVLRAARELLAY